MKALFTFIFLAILMTSYGQLQNTGRWKLDKVVYNDQVLFDRDAGPTANTDSRISITWKTSDENFNRQMNKTPYTFFAASEISFINDTLFVRTSTSIINGNYRNDLHFGKFTLEGEDVLNLDIKNATTPTIQTYKYSIEDKVLTLEKSGLTAIYKWSETKIDNLYDQPWNQDNAAIIIDAYHLNDIAWDEILVNQKLQGVIHKFGQGLRVDTKYNVRKNTAKKKNLLWGSYHLGTDDDPVEQAEFYYKYAEYDSTELYCLDLEDPDAKGMMDLKGAKKFIEHWHKLTGRYPVLYCNKNVLMQIDKKYGRESVFAKCPLWYARFRKDIPDWTPGTWEEYTFWQFSSEINCEKTGECLFNLQGVAYDMDINVFNGTQAELRLTWPRL